MATITLGTFGFKNKKKGKRFVKIVIVLMLMWRWSGISIHSVPISLSLWTDGITSSLFSVRISFLSPFFCPSLWRNLLLRYIYICSVLLSATWWTQMSGCSTSTTKRELGKDGRTHQWRLDCTNPFFFKRKRILFCCCSTMRLTRKSTREKEGENGTTWPITTNSSNLYAPANFLLFLDLFIRK